MRQTLELIDGASRCTVCPELGGSIVSWSVDGQNMLRRASEAAIATGDPRQLSSFPLVPYSNRIGFATFDWDGRTVELQPNLPPEPHAIHGVGWKQPWQVTSNSQNSCTLRLDHQANAHWPWSFTATQTFALADEGLTISLRARNLADEAAPMAFGHHPYFDQDGASLTFNAALVYMPDADLLPAFAIRPNDQFEFVQGGRVEGRDVDHCYAGWDQKARVAWDKRRYSLDIDSDMTCAVVYIPKDGEAFCFEPVPHINNALNRIDHPPAMQTLQPGESFSATIRMRALRSS